MQINGQTDHLLYILLIHIIKHILLLYTLDVKMFGFTLNEHIGKWAFWFWNIGFYVCFMPQYVLGLKGMTRRVVSYSWYFHL